MGEGTLIQLDGVPTYFVDSGGTRTPLLLIHGSGPGIDGPMSWAPVIDDLNHRFRTINVDSPGYGESEMLPSVRDTPENVSEHYLKLLDHLGVEKVVAVGHSRGGRIAVELAANHPDRVSQLMIVCSGSAAPGGHVSADGSYTSSSVAIVGFGLDGDPSYEKFKAALVTSLYRKELWTDRMLRPAYDRFMARRLDEWVRRMREFDPLHFYHVEDAEPFERKVQGMLMPTMVVAGREDETGPWNKSLPLVDMVSDVEFHVLPFCGHFPQYDQPAALVALMTDFMARKGAPVAAAAR